MVVPRKSDVLVKAKIGQLFIFYIALNTLMLVKRILDEDEIVNEKMYKNETKYSVDKAKGKANKYNKL